MTPERWQQIDRLVEAALELEASQRGAFLDAACAGDDELRREVEALLNAKNQASMGGFLETPAPVKFAGVLEERMIFKERYQAERELGRGGFGVAWLARDLTLLSRLVVVKVLQPQVDAHDRQQISGYRKRKFRDEVDALTRFRDPHIVGILDQGETPHGDPFLVMEFVEGVTLRQLMQRERPSLARVADIMRQAGQALSYAHERYVIHRDLKPDNLMLRQMEGSDFVVVIDFGIATVGEWKPATRGSHKTRPAGTPEYMAPEQIQGAPSEQSDIWALGVMAYEMLTGRLPFPVPRDERNTVWWREFYEMLSVGVQVKPLELRPELPATAETVILKAMAFDPAARYARACEFGEALAQALTTEPEPSPALAPTDIALPPTEIVTPQAEPVITPETAIRIGPQPAEVVISYDSRDLSHALRIAERLRSAGVACWMTDRGHEVTLNDRSETTRAIKQCKVVLLLCSDAALQSNAVKQDLQLAWSHERPYLPLLIERIDFAEQAEYWLEGSRWIEATAEPPDHWLPQTLQSLTQAGVHFRETEHSALPAGPVIQPTRLDHSLQSLRSIARFTDQIWPLPAERSAARSGVRGLGAPQPDVQHGYRLGSRVRLAIEAERAGHLLLLDEGPEGILYCLCPSHFAPDTRLQPGRSYLPQAGSHYDAFVVTGRPGREHLPVIITDEPLGLDWLPSDPKIPARILKQADIEVLLARLRGLSGDRWMVCPHTST